MPNELRNDSTWRCAVHAYVECRVRGGAWWLFARPTLPPDSHMPALLVDAGVDEHEEALHALGVPSDASLAVRDEYTWRVAGPRGGDAPNIVSVSEAERWIGRGRSRPWRTNEPFARVTDPRWTHGTWINASELQTLLERYEHAMEQPAPAAYCAVLAMMRALERDYVVRLILWLERRLTAADASPEIMVPLRDYPRELDRARAEARPRRPRKTRRIGSDS